MSTESLYTSAKIIMGLDVPIAEEGLWYQIATWFSAFMKVYYISLLK